MPDKIDTNTDEFKKAVEAAAAEQVKAQLEADESKKLEESKNWEALKKQLIEKHGKELKKVNAQAQKYRSAAEKWLIDAQLSDAITRAGGGLTDALAL